MTNYVSYNGFAMPEGDVYGMDRRDKKYKNKPQHDTKRVC